MPPHTALPARAILWIVVVLCLGADGYALWKVLAVALGQDTVWVALAVAALMVGSPAAVADAARLARSRVDGHGGGIAWIGVLVTLWAGLGATGTWLCATATGSGAPAEAAVLWPALYALSGGLVATHAYRFGRTDAAEIRRALRERAHLEAEFVRVTHKVEFAAAMLDVCRADRDRARKQRQRERDLESAWRTQLRADARQYLAATMGDPAATDALVPDLSGRL